MKIKLSLSCWAIIGLIATTAAGVGLGMVWCHQLDLRTEMECGYEMINPIRCLQPALEAEGGYGSLEKTITEYVDSKQRAGVVSRVGVHFRNLRNGATVGVNANEFFYPASLFKLPVAMAYYREAQNDPTLLGKTLTSPASFTLPEQITPKITSQIEPNHQYSVEELIRRMLVYSDNRALDVLQKTLPTSTGRDSLIGEILEDMGVLYQNHNGELVISARQYSSILRILYNTNFLNTDSSEKLLTILAKADYTEGLRRYLPAGTVVANKYGITKALSGGVVQLADCGIIYHPKVDYVLCVLVEGRSYSEAAEVIAEISKLTYQEIDRRYQ